MSKRKQQEADIKPPPKGQWFDRYKQCMRCRTWKGEWEGKDLTLTMGTAELQHQEGSVWWFCHECLKPEPGDDKGTGSSADASEGQPVPMEVDS